jgi:hypothetical protein
MKKIFGPVQNKDGFWIIRMNYELNDLLENAEWKPIDTRIRGRPRKRWIVDIGEDMQIIEIKKWKKQCKEKAEWKRITEKAKTHSGL